MLFRSPIKYQSEIITIGKTYNLQPELIASIINTESGYNPKAESYKGALGLMQIKLDTANYLNSIYNLGQDIKADDLFNPTTNITYGCIYLRYLINKFKDIETSLAAYNAGETNIIKWLKNKEYSDDGVTLKVIPFKETSNYVIKIKNNLKFYKKCYKNL